MTGPPWMPPLLALLAMSLVGCVTGSIAPPAPAERAVTRADLARVCAQPTPPDKERRILAELEAAPDGTIDTLAAEWGRQNDWARKCRGLD